MEQIKSRVIDCRETKEYVLKKDVELIMFVVLVEKCN